MSISYDDDETVLLGHALRLAIEIINHRDINAAEQAALALRDFAEQTFGEEQIRAAMQD